MVKVYSLDGITPVVHPGAYVHPSAVLIGDVIVAEGAYIGPTACLRGDFGRLIVERGANVQDSCILHGYPGTDTVIEEDGHIGHGAIIHGGRVCRDALVGMNAVINDNAVIGESAVVAAMAFVKAGMEVPPRTLAAGVPARIVRELTAVEIEWKRDGTRIYQQLTRRSLASMTEVEALTAVEPDRRRMDVGPTLPLSVVKKALGPG